MRVRFAECAASDYCLHGCRNACVQRVLVWHVLAPGYARRARRCQLSWARVFRLLSPPSSPFPPSSHLPTLLFLPPITSLLSLSSLISSSPPSTRIALSSPLSTITWHQRRLVRPAVRRHRARKELGAVLVPQPAAGPHTRGRHCAGTPPPWGTSSLFSAPFSASPLSSSLFSSSIPLLLVNPLLLALQLPLVPALLSRLPRPEASAAGCQCATQ